MGVNGSARRPMRLAAMVAATTLLVAGCSGDSDGDSDGSDPSTSGSQPSTSQGSQPPPPAGEGVTSIATWGDSLTAGNGGDGTTYPDVLAEDSGLTVFNGGVAGERSAGIAARQGGAPALLTVDGGELPAEGGVEVDPAGDVVIIRDEGELTGTVLDVHGTLTKDQSRNNGPYTFTRDEAGDAVPVPDGTPFVTDIGVDNRDVGTIIWAGHNDIRYGGADQVIENIRAMVDYLDTDYYVVLGLTNGENAGKGSDYYAEGVEGVNATLEQEYGPDHYLDVREYLVADGLEVAGIEPTADDEEDLAVDIVPLSLRDEGSVGHLNATGYTVLANYLDEFLQSKGWY